MAIRKYTNPRALDVSPGLQDVLRRNGIQAHISWSPEQGHQLIVLGHDSPVLKYNISEKQMESLMNWGNTYANKNAYNTFASIVRKDFDMPDNYVSASNAFGRVAMGLHGYRIGHGEYGYDARMARMPWYSPFSRRGRGWAGDFVGWGPRTEGFHLRRIGNHAYTPYGPMVAERPDGRIKPGELRSGGYGFYYKGQRQETSVDVLDQLSIEPKIKPLEAAPRPQGKGIPFSEAINIQSEVTNSFTPEKFQEVLASHGIVIDAEKKTLTIQSNLSKVDLQYDLTDEELRKLTVNGLGYPNGVSVEDRLAVINDVIQKDFDTPLTMDMLETTELVSLDLKPDVRAEVEAPFIEQERLIAEQARIAQAREEQQQENRRIEMDPNAINGRQIQEIMGNKGWFQPVDHGREMYVGEIRVDKIPVMDVNKTNDQIWEENKAGIENFDSLTPDQIQTMRNISDRTADFIRENQGKYVMTAAINGEVVSHTISEKDYNKFFDLDDKHRLKMFDSVFGEVEIKSAHGRSLYDDDMYMAHDGQTVIKQEDVDIYHATTNRVDGAALQDFNEKKAFYRERAHGREVEVRDISVTPMDEGKYKMTAVINGQSISHEITQKQYDKFLAVDDYQRMKLFSKIFDEVDIKTRPGEGHNIGAALLAAFVATGELLTEGMHMGRGPRPEFYESRMPATVYTKQGVVNAADIAAANYRSQEANLNPANDEHMGRGL